MGKRLAASAVVAAMLTTGAHAQDIRADPAVEQMWQRYGAALAEDGLGRTWVKLSLMMIEGEYLASYCGAEAGSDFSRKLEELAARELAPDNIFNHIMRREVRIAGSLGRRDARLNPPHAPTCDEEIGRFSAALDAASGAFAASQYD